MASAVNDHLLKKAFCNNTAKIIVDIKKNLKASVKYSL